MKVEKKSIESTESYVQTDSNIKKKLALLTSTALMMPGLMNSAQASRAVEEPLFQYRFSNFSEAGAVEDVEPVEDNQTENEEGELARNEIDLHQFKLILPFSRRLQFDLDVKTESITGASAVYVRPDGVPNVNDPANTNNTPIMVLSESYDDQRTEIAGLGTYFFDDMTVGVKTGVSSEDDYFSLHFGGSLAKDFNNDNTKVQVGFGYTSTDITPVLGNGQANINDENEESKSQIHVYSELTQVIDAKSIALLGLEFNYDSGELNDPYKQVYVNGDILDENRPDNRFAVGLYGQYRRFVSAANGALHVNYRFHFDNWEMTSHTTEIGWYQGIDDFLRNFDGGRISNRLGDAWDMSLWTRYYAQGKANFYEHYYLEERADGLYSSDYRLSSYGALGFGFKIERQFTNWKLYFGYDTYISSGDFSFNDDEFDNPGLVDWSQVSIGVDLRFK